MSTADSRPPRFGASRHTHEAGGGPQLRHLEIREGIEGRRRMAGAAPTIPEYSVGVAESVRRALRSRATSSEPWMGSRR